MRTDYKSDANSRPEREKPEYDHNQREGVDPLDRRGTNNALCVFDQQI